MEQSLLQQGKEKARQQDYQGAIADFSEVIRLNPYLGEAYYRRGLAYDRLTNLHQAVFDYTEAISRGYRLAEVYYARALVRFQLQNFPGAKEDVKAAILANPKYASAYRLKGSIEQKMAMKELAITSFKQAANLYLEAKDSNNCRICLDKIKQLQSSAIELASPQSSLSSVLPSQEEMFAQILQKAEGNPMGAIEDLNWAIKADDRDARAYCCRGIIKSKIGDRQGAIADLNQALQIDPQQLIACRHRGQLRYQLGDIVGALADFEQALIINSQDEVSYIGRGNVRSAMGNYEGAIEDFGQAIAINSDNPYVYVSRAQAYAHQEEIAKAIADWQTAASKFVLKADWQNYQKTLASLQKFNSGSSQSQQLSYRNFAFLETIAPELLDLATSAEQYYLSDPVTCLITIKQFGELLAQSVVSKVQLYSLASESQSELLSRLVYSGVLSQKIYYLFSEIERIGQQATHHHLGERDHREQTSRIGALKQLQAAREISVWFYRNFGGDPHFQPEPFIPPDRF